MFENTKIVNDLGTVTLTIYIKLLAQIMVIKYCSKYFLFRKVVDRVEIQNFGTKFVFILVHMKKNELYTRSEEEIKDLHVNGVPYKSRSGDSLVF